MPEIPLAFFYFFPPLCYAFHLPFSSFVFLLHHDFTLLSIRIILFGFRIPPSPYIDAETPSLSSNTVDPFSLPLSILIGATFLTPTCLPLRTLFFFHFF
jgi:hypothetical protein